MTVHPNDDANPPGMARSTPPSNPMAVAGFVCALAAMAISWLPGINLVVWVCGLVFSIIGRRKSTREGAPHKGLATAGIWISVVPGLIMLLLLGLVVSLALLGGAIPA